MDQLSVTNGGTITAVQEEASKSPPTHLTTPKAFHTTTLAKYAYATPTKQLSTRVLRKERSDGDVLGSHHDTAFVNHTDTMPKLKRQVSLALNRAKTTDGFASPPPPTASSLEQDKIERYERMMDRFQLRRMTITRAGSSSSVTAGTSPTYRDGVPTARVSLPNSSRNLVASDAVGTANKLSTSVQNVAAERSRRSTVKKLNFEDPTNADPRLSMPSQRVVWETFEPMGLCTRVRLLLMVLVHVSQVVYMPYGIVYYPREHAKTIVSNGVVDVAFLLNIVATCNTATHTVRGQPIWTRHAIWRHYRQHGLCLDVLAAVPLEMVVHFVEMAPWLRWIVCSVHLLLQFVSLHRHTSIFHALWAKEGIRTDKSVVAWMLYSRYSHLVRIGGIVLMITLMAHYFACVWSYLQADVDPGFFTTHDSFAIHLHSIYDALQLLQGQGLPTTTPAQDFFGSFVVLLGSIALAVVFGHVAVLVSNFSANQTMYQRKMESVFSVMGKLELPHPIRERVHQYYEYLHAEYESLDGEIVKFAKELSHSLELEVALFKYMDVLMHVPYWRACSPDFQKQLVLNLNVRVYLPDDFIMRRGEVGTECYIINRGTCKQHEYPTGNYESPTMPVVSEEDAVPPAGSRGRRSSRSYVSVAAEKRIKGASRYSVHSGRSEAEPSTESFSRVTVLKRGQAIGSMSLLANYERSSDLRAVTYVEMCVIERDVFQRILTRYPRDREIVLGSIVQHTMMHLANARVPCMLMQMVREVVPQASVVTGIKLVSEAMNPRESDPSILFGVTEQMAARMHEITAYTTENSAAETADPVHVIPPAVVVPASCPMTLKGMPNQCGTDRHESFSAKVPLTAENELLRMVLQINQRLARMEERQQTYCRCHGPLPSTDESQSIVSPRSETHAVPQNCPTMVRNDDQCTTGAARVTSVTSVTTPQALTVEPPECHDTTEYVVSPLPAQKRMLRGLAKTLWARSVDTVQPQASPTPWADQLYQSQHRNSTSSAEGFGGSALPVQRPSQFAISATPLHPRRKTLRRTHTEKEELQNAIYSMEAEQEQVEAEQQGVAALKVALEERKQQRQLVQDELDKQKHFLTRLKAKMTRMVDVQMMAARDTNPPTISEEMVILHLLYEHAGEMDMNELKQATTDVLVTYGKTTSSAAVLRAIYSLVGSLAVHIDRSIGNGVVTSLLV